MTFGASVVLGAEFIVTFASRKVSDESNYSGFNTLSNVSCPYWTVCAPSLVSSWLEARSSSCMLAKNLYFGYNMSIGTYNTLSIYIYINISISIYIYSYRDEFIMMLQLYLNIHLLSYHIVVVFMLCTYRGSLDDPQEWLVVINSTNGLIRNLFFLIILSWSTAEVLQVPASCCGKICLFVCILCYFKIQLSVLHMMDTATSNRKNPDKINRMKMSLICDGHVCWLETKQVVQYSHQVHFHDHTHRVICAVNNRPGQQTVNRKWFVQLCCRS